MAWEGLEGHDAIAARFAVLDRRGRLAGSYLFVGPPDIGKATFARRLARAVLCLEPATADGGGLSGCGRCLSCIQFDAGSHPDFNLVEKPEDRATIPLEAFIGDADHRMREGLCWNILLRPALSRRRVALILDADALSEESANCLLKTLEEPPDGSMLILVGTAVERQLPTIRSRCQIVRFRPPDPNRYAGPAQEPDVVEFRRQLASQLAAHPLKGVQIARDVTAWVEAAGKEPPARRARLKLAMDAAVGVYRDTIRRQATTDGVDLALARLAATLDAIEAIDANANLTVLVDAWTALLEEPRLAHVS